MQGIILINKPSGPTSFGAVARIKRIAQTKRVGHTGTLDPLACGVLPVLVGRAAVLSDYLLCADKRYKAVCRLGITTDTYDITGKVECKCEPHVSKEELQEALNKFKGNIMQCPPAFSAIKKDGVRSYKLAREGESVKLDARPVEIKQLDLISFDGNDFTVDVICSKGTYIRSLCHDIGKFLGCGAVLTALQRTATGGFTLDDCISLDDLNEENIQNYCKNEDIAVAHLPFANVTFNQAKRFSNGGELDLQRVKTNCKEGELLRIKYGDILVGLGYIKDNSVKIKCVVNNTFLEE